MDEYFEYSVDLIINSIKIINKGIIGQDVVVKIGDVQPIVFGSLNSKIQGRATVEFSQGYHVNINTYRKTVPTKILAYIYIQAQDTVYLGGVNIAPLIQDSISRRSTSSIAKESIKLKNESEKDGALVTFKVRAEVKNLPQIQAKRDQSDKPISMRATDFFRTNQQYRKMAADLQAQVQYLQAKVNRISNNQYQAPPEAEKQNYKPESTASTQNTHTSEIRTYRRTRPPVDIEFNEKSASSKRPRLFSTVSSGVDDDSNISAINGSDDDSDVIGSDDTDAMLESDESPIIGSDDEISGGSIGSSDDSIKEKPKKKKNKSNISDLDIEGIDSISSDSDEKPKKKKSKKSSVEIITDDSSSVSDKKKSTVDFDSIDDVSSDNKKKKKSSKKSTVDVISDSFGDDSSSDKKKKSSSSDFDSPSDNKKSSKLKSSHSSKKAISPPNSDFDSPVEEVKDDKKKRNSNASKKNSDAFASTSNSSSFSAVDI